MNQKLQGETLSDLCFNKSTGGLECTLQFKNHCSLRKYTPNYFILQRGNKTETQRLSHLPQTTQIMVLGAVTQGCLGPVSLGQGRAQPGGAGWDDPCTHVSLHLQVHSQLPKSRPLRLVPLSLLLGGTSQPCHCVSTGGRLEQFSGCQELSFEDSNPEANEILLSLTDCPDVSVSWALPFSRLSKALDSYGYLSASSRFIQEGFWFSLQANSLHCLPGCTKPPFNSSDPPRCVCSRTWFLCS